MPDAFEDPFEIVLLGSKLPNRRRGMGGHQHFLTFLGNDSDREMPEGPFWHLAFELVKELEIFLRNLHYDAPHPFAWRGSDAPQTTSPLGGPPAELNRMILQVGLADELVFRCPPF